jgi:hypothetical protein
MPKLIQRLNHQIIQYVLIMEIIEYRKFLFILLRIFDF